MYIQIRKYVQARKEIFHKHVFNLMCKYWGYTDDSKVSAKTIILGLVHSIWLTQVNNSICVIEEQRNMSDGRMDFVLFLY